MGGERGGGDTGAVLQDGAGMYVSMHRLVMRDFTHTVPAGYLHSEKPQAGLRLTFYFRLKVEHNTHLLM